MIELLKRLCAADGTAGDEGAVRDLIYAELDGYCDLRTDPLGNIIAFKQGQNRPAKRLLLDAHTDEIGLIITSATESGMLRFQTVGGIDTAVLTARRVVINGKIPGVIGGKPIHLIKGDEAKKLPKLNSLYIDIGAGSRDEALALVSPGDRAVLAGAFVRSGDLVRSKALDDRIGCAVLITLLREPSEYDFYASFTVQEEIGTRGAKTAAYTVNPDAALILEATTAADIAGVAPENQVCTLGGGAAVSFMDRATVYDRAYYNAALESGIPCQPKRAVAGGNNAGAVHLSRGGVRSLAISVPCRYIHSASCTADVRDIDAALRLTRYLRDEICGGGL